MLWLVEDPWSTGSLPTVTLEARCSELLVTVATLLAFRPERRTPSVLLVNVATAVRSPVAAWAPWLRESESLPPCQASCRHTKHLIRLSLGTMIACESDESLRRQAHQTT
jgi:hypothetical protein